MACKAWDYTTKSTLKMRAYAVTKNWETMYICKNLFIDQRE